ncbi:disease resistance protein Roq1-like [Gastrolobium bilobum]|uniref:disease resistance protein Roq1-like n=1 Tax=Gastrolobium bilobum TaxID=150636 RepID=UPI002AB2AC3E|nr:disease resistance protein Roq1-like [Gastrolobium bilobum]
MESQLREITSLLELESDERTIMLGIWGMSGVGKTTLARAVHNSISDQFEGLCFLADVRQKSHDLGIVTLQETLLCEIVEEKDNKFADVSEIIPLLRQRFHRKKILLILDDVSEPEQLKSLAGGCDWFGSGSRVIITTRDRRLLLDHGVDREYALDPLDEEEALELFCWKAFENKEPDPVYMNLSKQVVRYSNGIPLVLELIGSYLFDKLIVKWKSVLKTHRRFSTIANGLNDMIFWILKICYDSLDEDVKTIFLDIACCFHGYELDHVTYLLLNGRGFHPGYGLQVLISKSFVKIDGGLVKVHDLIKDLAIKIFYQESPSDPGKRSRLWYYKDVLKVLRQRTGTSCVEVLKIDLPKGEEVHWDGTGFKKMTNLKILEIRNARFSEIPKIFPNNLKVLIWKGCFN